MFTSYLPTENESQQVKSHIGVDLSATTCNKLQKYPYFSNYDVEDLHYVIDAVQKGLKPHTQFGLKRLRVKNAVKRMKKRANPSAIQELNPKSPELICMKALRTEFRNKLEQNFVSAKAENPLTNPQKIAKIAKRKEHQRQRRNELIKLVKKYRQLLTPKFGQRLTGYGRCPKVSRIEIKDFLSTKGIVASLIPTIDPLLLPAKVVKHIENPYEALIDSDNSNDEEETSKEINTLQFSELTYLVQEEGKVLKGVE